MKIFQFQDMLDENCFLDTFWDHSKRHLGSQQTVAAYVYHPPGADNASMRDDTRIVYRIFFAVVSYAQNRSPKG